MNLKRTCLLILSLCSNVFYWIQTWYFFVAHNQEFVVTTFVLTANVINVIVITKFQTLSYSTGLRDGTCTQELSENEKFEVENISEEIRILEERLARFLSLKNPATIPPSPKTAKKSSKNTDNRKTGSSLEPGNVATSDSNVSFGALPRKVPGKKFEIQMNK